MNSTDNSNSAKYLINCQDGANNIERASIAFVLAASASKEHEAAVFLTADAATLCVQGGSNNLAYPGMEPLSDLIEQFVGNGGHIWLCPICAKVKGINEADLISGAQIAGAPKTMAFLASGAKLLA